MMKKYQFIFGVDVSKKTLDICLIDRSERIINVVQIENKLPAIKRYFKQIIKAEKLDDSQILVCLEATGVYSNLITSYLTDIGIAVWVVHPTHAKNSVGLQRGKNDKLDAKHLAKFANRNELDARLWVDDQPNVKKIKALLKTREQMQKSIHLIHTGPKENKAFEAADINALRLQHAQPIVAHLKTAIKSIETQIKQIIKSDKNINKNYKLATSVTGVGFVTATYFICITNNFTKLLEPNKLACYCGVVPFSKSSGSSLQTKARVSHAAHKIMKKILHTAAMSTINAKDDFATYYKRKVEVEKKNKMLVINNIRHKIIKRVLAVVKRATPYYKYQEPVVINN